MRLQKILESVEYFFDQGIIQSFSLNPNHSRESQQGKELGKLITARFQGELSLIQPGSPFDKWMDHLEIMGIFQGQEPDKILIDPEYGYEINQGVILNLRGKKNISILGNPFPSYPA